MLQIIEKRSALSPDNETLSPNSSGKPRNDGRRKKNRPNAPKDETFPRNPIQPQLAESNPIDSTPHRGLRILSSRRPTMTGPYEDAAALRCGNLHERMKFLIALLDQNLDRVPQDVRHAALELEAAVRKRAPLEVDPAETADTAALDRMLVQWDGLKALLREDAGRLIARTPPISMTRLIQRELEEFVEARRPRYQANSTNVVPNVPRSERNGESP